VREVIAAGDRAMWRVDRVTLDAGDAHAADLTGPDATRLVRVHEITRPTLVLGSTQRDSDVDTEAAARLGVAVVRRRSGGGAVLLVGGDVVWVDVVVPAGDPLWEDDVGVAFEWLGTTWMHALSAVGVHGAVVHRGRLVRSSWSERVCFAGLGPGEVTIDGQKVVGISQRRTRHAARFQCAVLLRWNPACIAELLGLEDSARALEGVAVGAPVPADALVQAFLTALP
jgi:lipoate-protein ligase A